MMIEKNKVNKVQQNLSKCCTTPANSQKKVKEHTENKDKDKKNSQIILFVEGMTCSACARKIESALLNCSGVIFAAVNLSEHIATVHFNPHETNPDNLKNTITAVGYSVLERTANSTNVIDESRGLLSKQTFDVKPYLFGVTAAVSVIGFYLGLLTIVSDWYNAASQFEQYWGWIIALALGLGIQATLFSYIKVQLKGKTITAAKSSLAASGGVSTASMAACCAHYLVALLPVFGLPFFSAAAAGLAKYQVEFFFLGVISNVFGIFVMIRVMNNYGLIPAGFLAKSLTIGL
jgi:cation transport ATPase